VVRDFFHLFEILRGRRLLRQRPLSNKMKKKIHFI